MGVKCLAQEHNTMTQPGLEPGSSRSGVPLISYPESSGSLVSGLVTRRDSGEMECFNFFYWLFG